MELWNSLPQDSSEINVCDLAFLQLDSINFQLNFLNIKLEEMYIRFEIQMGAQKMKQGGCLYWRLWNQKSLILYLQGLSQNGKEQ